MNDESTPRKPVLTDCKVKKIIFAFGVATGVTATVVGIRVMPIQMLNVTAEQVKELTADPTLAVMAKTINGRFAARIIP